MANAKIEIIPTAGQFKAQMVSSDGTVTTLKGRYNTAQEAQRAMLQWKSEVKGADIKMTMPVPEPAEEAEEESVDGPDDESLHAESDVDEPEDDDEEDDEDDEDDDEEEEVHTVDSLMDTHTKKQLLQLAEDYDVVADPKSSKTTIATAIIDAWAKEAEEEG